MKIRKTCLNKQILKGLRPVTKNTQIFKMTNIGRLTFLLLFFTLEIHEKSTKNEEYQCDVTQVLLVFLQSKGSNNPIQVSRHTKK